MNIKEQVKPYAKANKKKSFIQILNTVVPYILLMSFMIFLIDIGLPYYITILFTIPAGLFMVRVFILFHDCTHLSFYSKKKSNIILGHILGVLVFTPYFIWQSDHNIHHGSVGNLDKRGTGDVWTMTVKEYIESSKMKKFIYRLYRNPFFLFFIAPFFLFAVLNRLPSRKFKSKKHQLSNIITSLGILSIFLFVGFTFGFKHYILTQIPVLYIASVSGVWLFFIQHQFEEVYWKHHDDWDFVEAAIKGSSFYKLPWLLDWITGHIGFHHIHHLNPRIPNYNLRLCYKSIKGIDEENTVTLFKSFKLSLLKLYDENKGRLVTFKELKKNKDLHPQ
ncbi:MAG: fatty acid desaturase [Firmicutes bacterium]|jgi:omega-6 fatty acid desaturase (delta-12 desaturase)|nr:fatty acid desaturase [Bacillota bacterium]